MASLPDYRHAVLLFSNKKKNTLSELLLRFFVTSIICRNVSLFGGAGFAGCALWVRRLCFWPGSPSGYAQFLLLVAMSMENDGLCQLFQEQSHAHCMSRQVCTRELRFPWSAVALTEMNARPDVFPENSFLRFKTFIWHISELEG
jgi:hypothetical protein